MKRTTRTLLLVTLTVGILPRMSWAHEADLQYTDTRTPEGYVLHEDQGEVLTPTNIIKASPKQGTQGSVLIYNELPGGFSTGVHVHLAADELFYVVSGGATVVIDDREQVVGPGDVIVVPAGTDHKVVVPDGGKLEEIMFLDRPGLDEEFRASHAWDLEHSRSQTLEEMNRFGRPNGTVYKTLR